MIHFQITKGWFIGCLLALFLDGVALAVVVTVIAILVGGLTWA